jgi:DnaJ family protein C protein 17
VEIDEFLFILCFGVVVARTRRMDSALDPFEVLGVDIDASEREVKQKYRKLAIEKHPDKNLDDPEAGARFAVIVEAYETLMNPELRLKYENIIRAKRERQQKLDHMDQRRREQREELARREQEEAQRRMDHSHAQRVKKKIESELERVRQEIRRQRQLEKQVLETARAATFVPRSTGDHEDIVPPLPQMELEDYEQLVFAKVLKRQ